MELLMEKPLQGRMCTILSAVIIAIFLPASTGSEGMTSDSSSEPQTNNTKYPIPYKSLVNDGMPNPP